MNEFKPKLFSVMKNYSGSQLVKDIIAGIIVAIIALPLSIALAIASGVGPEAGIYTAIVAGFIVSLLGGSRVQIAGPTAAFATIVAGIVMKDGREGLMIATIMAGIILIIMGICRFGSIYSRPDHNRLYRRHRSHPLHRTDQGLYRHRLPERREAHRDRRESNGSHQECRNAQLAGSHGRRDRPSHPHRMAHLLQEDPRIFYRSHRYSSYR